MAIADKNIANENFWCNLSAENIYSSADRRQKSVDALKAIILYAFGLFSVGGFMLNIFGAVKDFDSSALYAFGIAFFLLTVAYFLAGQAQFPAEAKYKQADPVEIAEAHNKSVRQQSRWFRGAAAVTGVAFFSLAIGILIQFATVKDKKTAASPPAPDLILKTGMEKKGDTIFIPVTAQWKKNEPIHLSYIKTETVKSGNTSTYVETPFFSRTFYADTAGRLFYSLPILPKDSIKTLIVRASIQKTTADTTIEKNTSVKLSLP
jgi:hypothetical protein